MSSLVRMEPANDQLTIKSNLVYTTNSTYIASLVNIAFISHGYMYNGMLFSIHWVCYDPIFKPSLLVRMGSRDGPSKATWLGLNNH